MRELSVPSESLIVPATTMAGTMLVSGRGILTGFGVRENTDGANADADIIDGTRSSGNPLIPITLDPHESWFQWFGLNGPVFQNGLFFNVTSGTIRGTMFVVLESMLDVDGVRVLFGQSGTGHYVPVAGEIDMERG
jgi:hypothetical protein